jgi:hypothetical protein
VSFGTGISLDMAKVIAEYEGSYCSLSKWEERRSTGRKEILSAPHIHLDNRTGNYTLDAGYCLAEFAISDGNIKLVRDGGTLR